MEHNVIEINSPYVTSQKNNLNMSDIDRFNRFLSEIDLEALRERYQHIKIVELDMPRNVQALECIYHEYWRKREDWPDYEAFYGKYVDSLSNELEEWRERAMFSKETFYRGLPARIYRTWASLLTQIQGAYVAEVVYGVGNVDMGVDIDHSGKDLVINLGNSLGRMPIQIKKRSRRPEARRLSSPRNRFIQVVYEVPRSGPLTKTGKESKPYRRWHDEWGTKLERLDNGFIIFKKEMFVLTNLLEGTVE